MAFYPFPQPLGERFRQLGERSANPYPEKYEIIYSSRSSLALQITPQGEVRVRAPRKTPRAEVERLLLKKQKWILKHLSKAVENALPAPPPPLPESERRRYMETARDIFTKKTAYYASVMGVTYGRITIREQKTRWGSCSSDGNLNFNWRIIFAPEEVLDYIVVHELAHRREMNHSPAFYRIVESVLPDYKKEQKWLKEHGGSLWTAV